MACLGPPFLTPKIPPKKVYVRPLFCVLSQEMRCINFFWGSRMWCFGLGAKKFMLNKFVCVCVCVFSVP